MKKIIAPFIVVTFLFLLCSCGFLTADPISSISSDTAGSPEVPSSDLGYNEETQWHIVETSMSPEEYVADRKLLCDGEGQTGLCVMYYQGVLYRKSDVLGTKKTLDDTWSLFGETKTPVYPWETPKEDFVTNCLVSGVPIYTKETEDGRVFAVPYKDVLSGGSEAEDCYKFFTAP